MTNPLFRRARLLSPRHRRWQTLLDSCTFRPESALPLTALTSRDFIICGHSRSGTALATAALWSPPEVVTVMEPWDCFRMPPSDLFASIRSEVATTAHLSRGRLDIAALENDRRVGWQRDGERAFPVSTSPDFLLGIKMPAFWRYLEYLPTTKFVVCLRNPTEVIASYGRVGGRLGKGLDYDIPFNQTMNVALRRSTQDHLIRQIHMFDYIAERILPHLASPNVHVVRYERWSTDPQGQLADLGRFLGAKFEPLSVDIDRAESAEPPSSLSEAVARYCRTAQALGY